MNKKCFTLPILLLLINGCEEAGTKEGGETIDYALRGFLDIATISARVKIPSDKPLFAITSLEFVDGVFVNRGTMIQNSAEQIQGNEMQVQLLWGERNGQAGTTLKSPSGVTHNDTEFWTNMQSRIQFSESGEQFPDYKGFLILGFAQSDETQEGHKNSASAVLGNFEQALKAKRYVGALAIYFHENKEAEDEWAMEAIKRLRVKVPK